LVREYESECLSTSSAASHTGFLIWCSSLVSAEEDTSAFDPTADAVHVTTWHGSKGLEWPVVICLDTQKEPRPRIWNSPTVLPAPQFDIENPLHGRRIRFWINPFGKQTKEVRLLDRAEESPVGRAAISEADAEQSRLQYVALTRARDFLVLPNDGNSKPWLPSGVECTVFDPIASDVSTDEICGIRRQCRRLSPAAPTGSVKTATTVVWFPEPLAPGDFLPAEITPSAIHASAPSVAEEPVSYGNRFAIDSAPSDAAIGNALHAILAEVFFHTEGAQSKIPALLHAHGVKADAKAVEESVSAFLHWVRRTFEPAQVLVEVPFSHWNAEGQRVAGNMDLVLVLQNGEAVLIDHKSYQGADLQAHAAGHFGQIAAYREALTAHGRRVHSAWIHFCTQGKAIRLP